MTPLFFGTHDKQLLGVHHPPAAESGSPRAVLLCYPAAQEYLRTHWAFRRLAAALAKEGAHVLRFDYFGTGDSAGDARAGTVEQWTQDVATAAEELKDLSGAPRISVVGFRFGAALASLATLRGLEVDSLVLWEPVVSGAAYLEELGRLHRHKAARALYRPRVDLTSDQAELLGFPLPLRVRAGTEQVDLRATPPRAARTFLMVSEERAETQALLAQLRSSGRQVDYHHLPEAKDGSGQKLEAAMLSDVMLKAIARLWTGGAT